MSLYTNGIQAMFTDLQMISDENYKSIYRSLKKV